MSWYANHAVYGKMWCIVDCKGHFEKLDMQEWKAQGKGKEVHTLFHRLEEVIDIWDGTWINHLTRGELMMVVFWL